MHVLQQITVFPLRNVPSTAPYGGSRYLAPARVATLVKVMTQDGIVGWGECFGPPLVVASYLRELAPLYLGQPIEPREQMLHQVLHRWYHQSTGGLHVSALSGLDIALWDAHARSLGISVAQLLGGGFRKSLPCYASTGYLTGAEDLTAFRETVAKAVDEGFRAVKIKVGAGVESDQARVAIARAEMGPDRQLLLDYNANYTAALIQSSVERIREYQPYWIEEPVPPEDQNGWRQLRTLQIAIAAGEALQTRFGFRDPLTHGWFDVIQPDVTICGGITEAKAIAQLAMLWNVLVSPHCWGTDLAQAATLQLMASVPDVPFGDTGIVEPLIEVDRGENALREGVLATPLQRENGRIQIPQEAGLGVIVNEEFLQTQLIEPPLIFR